MSGQVWTGLDFQRVLNPDISGRSSYQSLRVNFYGDLIVRVVSYRMHPALASVLLPAGFQLSGALAEKFSNLIILSVGQ
jgi:hypothetical protein